MPLGNPSFGNVNRLRIGGRFLANERLNRRKNLVICDYRLIVARAINARSERICVRIPKTRGCRHLPLMIVRPTNGIGNVFRRSARPRSVDEIIIRRQ